MTLESKGKETEEEKEKQSFSGNEENLIRKVHPGGET